MRRSGRHSHQARCELVFPGQNLQAAPVSFGQRCSRCTTPSSILTGKPLDPHSLGPFMVELFGGRSFESVPAVVDGGSTSCLADTSPRQLRCADSDDSKPSPHRRDYFAMSPCSIAAEHSCDLTRFVSTRPSFKDYSQEGLSESPRFRYSAEKSEARELNNKRDQSIAT